MQSFLSILFLILNDQTLMQLLLHDLSLNFLLTEIVNVAALIFHCVRLLIKTFE